MRAVDFATAMDMVRASDGLSAAERKALSYKRLCELLEYAKANSPYLASKYKDVKAGFSLGDIPVSKKSQLQENFDDWVTDREASKQGLDAHIAACAGNAAPPLYLGKYSYVITSGTTGTPFRLLRDASHNNIHGALMTQRLTNAVGADVINPAKNKVASVILTNPSVSSYGSFLRAKNAMPEYSSNMLAISITQPIESIAKTLDEFKPDVITGYPSILSLLAKLQLSGKMSVKLKAVVCSAELLSLDAYNIMKAAFGCPILNNYCMTEGGEVAFSNGLCPELHVNDDWIIVEPVKNDLSPAEPGELSDGILVTDLSNFICPIIRYYMTDRVSIKEQDGKCACGSRLPILKISGRILPPLIVCSRLMSMIPIETDLEEMEGVMSYQIARVASDTLEIRFTAKQGADFSETAGRVSAAIRHTLDEQGFADAKFTVLNKAPVIDPKSGKTKIVIDELIG